MRLEVVEYAGPERWRWRVADGVEVAEHQINLDVTAWQFEAFTDLHAYLRRSAVPDRRAEHEAKLVKLVGEWITAEVLGPVAALVAPVRGPVRLVVPAEAAGLGYRPWELARVDGRTLAEHRVTFVVDQQPHHPLGKNEIRNRLRMLAVFSLPEGAGALNLRRERHELTRLVQQIARVNNKAVELRVLQYGATRRRLEDVLLEAPGWDVVHVSGHGLAGGLVLEDDAGRHDVVTSTELVELLDLCGDQIKLVTLSACESAAVTAAEHLQHLGLAPADLAPALRDSEVVPAVELPAVAAALVDRLDCAVLAMRYPVVDDFAIELAGGFYDLLLGRGQPVARALSLTLPRITRPSGVGVPALSVGTPVLFGPRAADLTLTPPAGEPDALDESGRKLAGFPPQPDRFVGRVGPMTRATTALAPASCFSGIVFHGMAGGGKTACAVELAYTHRESFPVMAFHAAPAEGLDITTALSDFALALERQIGLKLAHLVADTATLRAALPGLTRVMQDNRMLVVLDNVESLLTPDGQWRDQRWQLLIDALCAHRGLSRLVLTSRIRPTQLGAGVLVEPIHALSVQEAVLLARDWPHLRALIDAAPLPPGMSVEGARELAARTLRIVQGHPKLIELADGHAGDPEALVARLDEADATWLATATRLDTFLHRGESTATDTDFLTVLHNWTQGIADTLPAEAATLFHLLCCLEEPDRIPVVVETLWPILWQQHLQPDGQPNTPTHPGTDTDTGTDPGELSRVPELVAALAPLLDHALVATTTDPDTGQALGYRIHPGIADTGRTTTDPDLATTIDTLTGDLWLGQLAEALAREHDRQLGWLILRAARCAGPYLLRQHRWTLLGLTAEQLLHRDTTTATAAALLPLLDAAVAATRDTPDELGLGRTHARALSRLNPAAGEDQLRELLHAATTSNDYRGARVLTGDLIGLCGDTGRLDEALTLAETLPDYTRQAGLGPWTQLSDQAQRLQILQQQGHYRQVLDTVLAMQRTWADLPDLPEPHDSEMTPWNVREFTLSLGCLAARDLQQWQQALDLNADNLDSKRRRGASPSEQARALFNNYWSLLQLGCVGEARDLLHHCRTIFETDNDIRGLGRTLGALATVEYGLGHLDLAITLETDALRYKYLAGDPQAIAVSHNNLADYLRRDSRDPRQVWAHHLASAVVTYQTGEGSITTDLQAIARLLDTDPGTRPTTIDEVIATVDQLDGIHLATLLDRLPHRGGDPQTALTTILNHAPQAAQQAQADHNTRLIQRWDPVLAALHTALHHPDPDTRHTATTTLTQVLDTREQQPDWRDLAHALRRLLTGDHNPTTDNPDTLLTGLDTIDTTITQRALDLLTGTNTHNINPDTWHTLTTPEPEPDTSEVEAFVEAIAAATTGDATARTQIGPALQEMATNPDWAPLAAALTHLIDTYGANPGPVEDLAPDHTAFLDAVQQAIHARLTSPPTLGPPADVAPQPTPERRTPAGEA